MKVKTHNVSRVIQKNATEMLHMMVHSIADLLTKFILSDKVILVHLEDI